MTAWLPLNSVLPICLSERPVVPADELPLMPIDEQPVIAITNTAARIVFIWYSSVDLMDVKIILRSEVFCFNLGQAGVGNQLKSDQLSVRRRSRLMEWSQFPLGHFDAVSGRGDHAISFCPQRSLSVANDLANVCQARLPGRLCWLRLRRVNMGKNPVQLFRINRLD
jgi:hypothetical protein